MHQHISEGTPGSGRPFRKLYPFDWISAALRGAGQFRREADVVYKRVELYFRRIAVRHPVKRRVYRRMVIFSCLLRLFAFGHGAREDVAVFQPEFRRYAAQDQRVRRALFAVPFAVERDGLSVEDVAGAYGASAAEHAHACAAQPAYSRGDVEHILRRGADERRGQVAQRGEVGAELFPLDVADAAYPGGDGAGHAEAAAGFHRSGGRKRAGKFGSERRVKIVRREFAARP